jgi:hypothetical protein
MSTPQTLSLPLSAERFGMTVEAYKAEVIDRWSKPQGPAVAGGTGYGYRVVEASGGLCWRIYWSDGTNVVVTKPVAPIDWSKKYPF